MPGYTSQLLRLFTTARDNGYQIVTQLIGVEQDCECYGPWRLKNSLVDDFHGKRRARMPYKTFGSESRYIYLGRPLLKIDFFNTHAVNNSLPSISL